jgi:hypothetical protein
MKWQASVQKRGRTLVKRPIHDFAAMFIKITDAFISSGPRIMDSDLTPFQSALEPLPFADLPLASMPPRSPGVMPAGEIVAWTAARMLWAFGAWLMEETQLPAPLVVNSTKRRA